MKIGILTYHKSINNGAVMQCYSLSKRLQQEFPDDQVEVIDFHMPKIAAAYKPTLKQYMAGTSGAQKIRRFLLLAKRPGKLRAERERYNAFERVSDLLPLSADRILDNGTDRLFRYINENYDVVIAGSDAIWNYISRGFPNPYYLDETVSCKKLSYAASCYGMVYENIPQEHKSKICRILNSYDFLGVRDNESENFLKHIGAAKRGVHTCDPTAFLDVNDLPIREEELRKKLAAKGFDFNRPAIGIMGTERMCKMVRRFYGKRYQIVGLYEYYTGTDVNLYDLTPYEWAYVFRFFRLTFTTYFHGTMLSLRNGTPVICIALETEFSKHHQTKVEDILTRLGLRDWYFHTDYNGLNEENIKAKADELLSGDFRQRIISAMDEEAKSVQPFLDALSVMLKTKKEEESRK